MKRTSKKSKIFLILFCTLIAVVVGIATYQYKFDKMTPWQQQQEIDFDKQTGSTKFQALIDVHINGGLAFCFSAIAITSIYKFLKNKKK